MFKERKYQFTRQHPSVIACISSRYAAVVACAIKRLPPEIGRSHHIPGTGQRKLIQSLPILRHAANCSLQCRPHRWTAVEPLRSIDFGVLRGIFQSEYPARHYLEKGWTRYYCNVKLTSE